MVRPQTFRLAKQNGAIVPNELAKYLHTECMYLYLSMLYAEGAHW